MNRLPIADTDQAGYTLFRQAIVEQDAEAWAVICAQYRPLLMCWVNQCSASSSASLVESSLDLADQALARAWVALKPASFGKFANLAKLLAYLRTCVAAAVIDCVRAQTALARVRQKLDANTVETPEQIAMHQCERAKLWRIVSSHVVTAQERTIVHECFMLDLPCRIILSRHPELFANITAVYAAKRNLLERLHRSPELRQFVCKQ